MKTVLFACVHNAGRSQIAAGFFNALANPEKARAVSAGTRPGHRVHPEVVAVMTEAGIDLTHAETTKLTPELAERAQMLVTMGCGDECPTCLGQSVTTGRSKTRKANRSNTFAPSETKFVRV